MTLWMSVPAATAVSAATPKRTSATRQAKWKMPKKPGAEGSATAAPIAAWVTQAAASAWPGPPKSRSSARKTATMGTTETPSQITAECQAIQPRCRPPRSAPSPSLKRRSISSSRAAIRAGSGRQFVSWVHEDDFTAAVRLLLEREDLNGVVNIASPNPLPNPQPQVVTVTGRVSLRERVFLPQNGTVDVQLLDVTQPGRAELIGQQQIRGPAQSPWAFALRVDSARIQQQGRYVMQCRVYLDRTVAWSTAAPVSVLTRGNPAQDITLTVEPVR